ncbi:hypothetical protein Tco_1544881, partial [Tanacetum coccineum]
MVLQLTMFHVLRVEMVINVPWFINRPLATPGLMANCDKDNLGDDASKQGRIDIGDINTDAEITLIDETQGRINDIGVSKEKSTDKGNRYRRRARSMAKKIDTGLDAKEEINIGREEINTGIEDVSTGSTKVDSGTASKKGQREGKALMVEEDIQATHKTKEQ